MNWRSRCACPREVLRTPAEPARHAARDVPRIGSLRAGGSHPDLSRADLWRLPRYRHSESTVTIVTVVHGARILQL